MYYPRNLTNIRLLCHLIMLILGIMIVLRYFIMCQNDIYKLERNSMIGPKPFKANYTHTSLNIRYNTLAWPNNTPFKLEHEDYKCPTCAIGLEIDVCQGF